MKRINNSADVPRSSFAISAIARVLITLFVMLLWAPRGGAQQAALVSIDVVRKQAFTQTLPITGRLLAKQAGAATARIDGTVAALHAQVGDVVLREQALATLDTATLELQRALAAARLQTSQAQLALAEQRVQRLHGLTASAAISQAAYDDAKQQRNIAAAREQEAQATLGLAELEMGYAEITAPFAGVVTERLTEVGSYLKRGDAVLRLLSAQQLEAEADIPSHRVGGLAVGDIMEMQLENGSLHQATVRAIVAEEAPATRTRRVRFHANFGAAAGSLAAGQSLRILIPLSAKRDIVSVHKDAVVQRGADSIVFVVVDEIAMLRNVRIGEASGDRVEVLDGLQPGDAVVVRGNERLQPNQKVAIANFQ